MRKYERYQQIFLLAWLIIAITSLWACLVLAADAAELGTFKGMTYHADNIQRHDGFITMEITAYPSDERKWVVGRYGVERTVQYVTIKKNEIRVKGGLPIDLDYDAYTREGTWGHEALKLARSTQ